MKTKMTLGQIVADLRKIVKDNWRWLLLMSVLYGALGFSLFYTVFYTRKYFTEHTLSAETTAKASVK